MGSRHKPFTWAASDGGVTDLFSRPSLPLQSLPDGLIAYAANVDFYDACAFRPRPPIELFSQAGTQATGDIAYLFVEGGATPALDALWSFCTSGTANRYVSSSWSSITLIDTPAATNCQAAASFNGKVFLAYNSTVNRLHVWDSTSAVVRRVGIGNIAAPTVANTGAGAYAAIARYYKVQQIIVSGSAVLAASELSAASTVFTPSGTGTAARVTNAAGTVDSATHWRVYGSADNITYYLISSDIVVATTTFDDTTAPASYSGVTGTVAPIAGMFVPPPSAKYLACDGERLLMAGAYETSAGTGETTPSVRRVWFTRPLGVTDEGDDESVTSTGEFRYWIDINGQEGGEITGLAATGGFVYVFFPNAVWRLVPTGIANVPFRSEQVASGAGSASQQAICVGGMGETGGNTDEAIYFFDANRAALYRYSPSRGLEWLGRDVVSSYLKNLVSMSGAQLAFDHSRRDLWFLWSGSQVGAAVIDVSRLRRVGLDYHGGARYYTCNDSTVKFRTGITYQGVFVFGGTASSGNNLHALNHANNGTLDLGTTAIAATAYGPIHSIPQMHLTAESPIVDTFGPASGAFALAVSYVNPFLSTPDTRTQTKSITLSSGNPGHAMVKFDTVDMSDAAGIQVRLSQSDGLSIHTVAKVLIPVSMKEAV